MQRKPGQVSSAEWKLQGIDALFQMYLPAARVLTRVRRMASFCLANASRGLYRLLAGAGLAVMLAAAAGGGTALAQSVPEEALRQSEDLQRRQQDFLDQQERLFRQVAPPQRESAAPREDAGALPEGGTCIPVKRVIFSKASVFEPGRLQKLVPDRDCLGIAQISTIVRDATNLYVDAGFVTSRAYLPEQDLSTGELRIEVLEGRVETVEIRQNGELRQRGHGALPGVTGQILNIRTIEQGLDQINGLSSKDAKISLKPGAEAGFSIVVVEITAKRPWRASVAVDNSGSESTGDLQLEGSFTVEDLFGQFETLSLVHKRSDPSLGEPRASESTSLQIAVPRGFWTWRWSSSFFQYSSEVEGQLQSFRTSGTNWTHKGEIERLLWRDQVSKTYARVSVSVKDARNYLEETKLDTSSRILSVLRGEVSHTRQMLGGSLTLQAGLDQGTTWFGAAKDRLAEAGAPRAQFLKSDGEISFLRGWQIGGVQVVASTRLAAQHSPDLLWSSEQLSLGGSSTVRGFDGQSLSAVNGLYSRNELSVTPPLIPENLAKYAGQLSLFAGLDSGWQLPGPGAFEGQEHVLGAALGARLQGGIVFGEISYERALQAPRSFSREPVLRLRAGLTLSNF